MGQQQLLLIVLGVIIVGIAIAVGISMFKSNAQSSNRDQVINDLNNLAAKAQQYYRKPTSMAGGGQSFVGFGLAPVDTGNANGSYVVTNTAPTRKVTFGLETRPKSPTTKSTKIFHEGHEGLYSFITLSLCSLRHFFVTFVVK